MLFFDYSMINSRLTKKFCFTKTAKIEIVFYAYITFVERNKTFFRKRIQNLNKIYDCYRPLVINLQSAFI